MLSGFAKAKKGERVLDLGTGTGIIPILMEAKTEAEDFKALEIQEESADMARRSVCYNHLEDKIEIVTGDIKEASAIFGASSFDVITTNPPYMIGCSQRNILFEFLAEAAAISLIGGVLGIVASLLVTPVAQYLGVRVELTPAAFLIALLFALITGTLFGFYPAYKASKLVPVEALGAE